MVEFDVIMFCWGDLITFIKRLTNARYANFGEKFALDTMLKRNDDNDDDDDGCGRCGRNVISFPCFVETRFSARALAFIRTKEERYTHASPTRSKSRQNFAPGVFNSKLRGDRRGRIVHT